MGWDAADPAIASTPPTRDTMSVRASLPFSPSRETHATALIERNMPGAGTLTADDLTAMAQKSCGVLNEMGPQIQWVQSYVSGDQIQGVYRAPNEEMVRAHARQGGIRADRVSEITTIIDPTTAE